MNLSCALIELGYEEPEVTYGKVRELCRGPSFLLQSREGGEKIARYSFLGFEPLLSLRLRERVVELEGVALRLKAKDPIGLARETLLSFHTKAAEQPRFFGGLVGYISYDAIRYYTHLLKLAKDDLNQRDCELFLMGKYVLIDHKQRKSQLLGLSAELTAQELRHELEELRDELVSVEPKLSSYESSEDHSSNLERKEFEAMVRKAKEYIRAGDILQVVLSQRFEVDFNGDPFPVYLNLLRINPSPYMYFLDFPEVKVIGSSPEMLVRVEGKEVRTFPIAGTRRRGSSEEEDKALEAELLRDEKERAEHVMLVDLARNDVGRVTKFGSVEVRRLMAVEKYSHVQHMVSEVVGELRGDKDEFDAFLSIFPAGTVTGAPKVRAMEIIEELEPTRRGIYAGAVGYFSFNRNLDSAIAIRTIVVQGKRAYVQAGAGVVADSKPAREYEEITNKGMALLEALR